MKDYDERQPKKQESLFSYISMEQRVPDNHPLRDIRKMVDRALTQMHDTFAKLYSHTGRPSIPPEYLLRTWLLQVFSRFVVNGC